MPPPWQRRVIDRSLGKAAQRSVDRSGELVFAAGTLLERSNGDGFTVQEVADLAKQSLRTLYLYFESKDDLLLAVFEEAQQAFARLVTEEVEEYSSPLERLACGIYVAVRLSERATRGISIGLAKLRTRLMEIAPEKLALAQAPMTALFGRLLEDASDAGEISLSNPEASSFMILALIHSLGVNSTLGKEYALDLPSPVAFVEFCLYGLHAQLPSGWEKPFEERWAAVNRVFSVADDLRVTSP